MSARQLALLVILVALAVPVAPAQASFTGLERLGPFTAEYVGAEEPHRARVRRGSGSSVSAGADTTPGNGRVLLDIIRPNPDLTSVTVHANEDETGTAGGLVPAGVRGLRDRPGRTGAGDGDQPLHLGQQGRRPRPARPASGCWAAAPGSPGRAGQVLLDGQLPDAALTAVRANAVEDETGTASSWRITAYAICADPVPGLQRVVVTGAVGLDLPTRWRPHPARRASR